MEELGSDDEPSLNEKHSPKIELKPLFSSFRYEFLSPNSAYPMVVNSSLSASQIDYLLRPRRLHHKAIGYTPDVLKGIHSSVCIHHILVEDARRPQLNIK